MFSYTKIVTIRDKHDIDIMSAVIENGIDQEYKFTAGDHGFFVSAALIQYNSDTEVIEDAKYGELIFEHVGWGNELDLTAYYTQLETHYCTDEELGIKRTDKTIMFPLMMTKSPLSPEKGGKGAIMMPFLV